MTTDYVGPFDRAPWPTQLAAHVVEPGPVRRIHGYCVAELARGATMAEVAWLALVGELPAPAVRRAFEIALILLAPIHVGEAGSHAALLARIAGAPATSAIAIGAVGTGEMVRAELAALAPWFAWLDGTDGGAEPRGAPPAVALEPAPTEAGRALVAWLRAELPDVRLPDAPVHRVACAYAVLHALAIRKPLVLETIAIWARLPAIAAEAAHARAGAIRLYPARVPDYQYVDDDGAAP